MIGDVELFVRERRAQAPACPFIAITGTNGKSTTTALIAHILRAAGRDTQLGGNIGTAVLTLDPPRAGRYYVVECSSYQIDLAPTLDPTAGILLNLTPDHLDRHGTMQHYAAIKERLVAGSDVAVVGVDDRFSLMIADRLERAGRKVVRISRRDVLADGIYADGTIIRLARSGSSRIFADLSIGGHAARHPQCAECGSRHRRLHCGGVREEEITSALATFPGLKHRMQPVARRGRVTFVNNSKATNADAAAPALSSYENIYWIAGGLPKEGGIAAWRPFPAHRQGLSDRRGGARLRCHAGRGGRLRNLRHAGKAVAHAAADAERSDGEAPIVLLSPACASFDQYKNFEARGEAFVAHVAALDGVTMLIDAKQGG